ncbi:MAG: GDSL-type esterase/lipase family protein [Planctomycetes bacterium]|jgi:lysophospholipase L1-like esterase|nr:GDSL-type esterase/lipase family protein [Planctomycetota bacterium]
MAEAPPHPVLSRRKKAAFAALAVALSLLALEALLGAAGARFGWEVDAPLAREQLRGHIGKGPMWSDADLLKANFSIYEDDRRLLWRIRPGLDLEIRDFLLPRELRERPPFRIRTDAGGRRGPHPGSAPGRTRVLCLGGSNTFGWGLNEGESFPERLEAFLDAGKSGGFAVANHAQPGYSSRQGLAQWEGEGRAWRPAWVVLEFGFNDGVRAPLADESAMARRRGPTGFLLHGLSRLRTVRLARWAGLRARSRASPPDPAALAPRVPPEAYRANVAALVRSCREAGATPILLGMRNKYPDELEALAAELNAPLVNADAIAARARRELEAGGGEPAWREWGKGFPPEVLGARPEWWVDADVAHYNRFVHERIARELADLILRGTR